jgi:hypothetical protein
MPRVKMLSILAGIIAALAVSATPALATSVQWKAINGSTSGTGHVIHSGVFKYIAKGTTEGTFTCEAKGIEAEWQIQTKGQIKEHQINGKQELAKQGPQLHIQVKKWGTCEATIGSTTGLSLEIGACNFQLYLPPSGGHPIAAVQTPCLIKAGPAKEPTCEIQIPAAMEKTPESHEGINTGLKETVIENLPGKGLIGKSNITSGGQGQLPGEGIYAQSIPKHPLCPLAPVTEEATLTGLEVEAVGVEED